MCDITEQAKGTIVANLSCFESFDYNGCFRSTKPRWRDKDAGDTIVGEDCNSIRSWDLFVSNTNSRSVQCCDLVGGRSYCTCWCTLAH